MRAAGQTECVVGLRGTVAFGKSVKLEDFESAALPHFDDLYRTAARVLGDRNEAEDLTQEAYLQAWKSFHRFETGTNCRAWLFKILFHVIHHHRRKWFNTKLIREGDEILEEVLTYEPPVPEQITDEDMLSALDRVPEDFREVLLLSDVQEFSYKEIADTLQIPLGTVMSRLSRGRKILRAQLTEGVPMKIATTKEGEQGA
jgi:RNA polymerase sigma-70 factor (ECF subfamily)